MKLKESKIWGYSWLGVLRLRFFVDDKNWVTFYCCTLTNWFAIGIKFGGTNERE